MEFLHASPSPPHYLSCPAFTTSVESPWSGPMLPSLHFRLLERPKLKLHLLSKLTFSWTSWRSFPQWKLFGGGRDIHSALFCGPWLVGGCTLLFRFIFNFVSSGLLLTLEQHARQQLTTVIISKTASTFSGCTNTQGCMSSSTLTDKRLYQHRTPQTVNIKLNIRLISTFQKQLDEKSKHPVNEWTETN